MTKTNDALELFDRAAVCGQEYYFYDRRDVAIIRQALAQTKAVDVDALTNQIWSLRSEIDCRIEHGAESGGHLNYVRQKLDVILKGEPK